VDFDQIVDHLLDSSKTIVGLRVVSDVEVFLGVAVSTVKDVVHTDLLVLEVVVVDVELT
jgi:hypothetical protein